MGSGQISGVLRAIVVIVLVFATIYALPNVLNEKQREALPSWLPHKAMNLGLDLQGGAHLVMEVDMNDVTNRATENLEDRVKQFARDHQIGFTGLKVAPNSVELVLRDPNQAGLLRAELVRDGIMVNNGADGEVQLAYTDSALNEMRKRALEQTLQVLRSRVDQFGVAEPLIQRQGDRRVIVELPGIQDVERAKAAIGKTAQLTFHLVDESSDVTSPIVASTKLRLMETVGQGPNAREVPIIVNKRPSLTGELLTSAAASFDQNGQPAVDIAFNSQGTRMFAQLSTQNVGKRFAIVLDGKVYSAPVFREAILGGRAQISGNFKTEEAQDLSAILNAGALPAKVNVVEERTIGPSLGADSVKAGGMAIVGGTLAVMVFMFLFYGLFGMAANIALLVNLVLLVAIMSLLGFTLTLPGMAGIVLALGMAVDANVLIFERIREEVDHGKKPLAAILGGFEGAFRTIFDGHVTSLVAGVVLFFFGTGPVKGFAVAQVIGLLASLFTSVTLTRWIILSWLRRTKPIKLPL
ncbi:MAG: protein translocase subunit SecD [Pseudomonas fluorescens]|nr:MAG: protein translocase subunit SecD [Pseudomonas fluorescens]